METTHENEKLETYTCSQEVNESIDFIHGLVNN